jgi:ribosomal protein S18 acetylase RimI-like enzyme
LASHATRIRTAGEDDLGAIVAIAGRELEPSLIVRLGPGFVRRLLALALRHPATSLLVAEDANEVVAFALATRDRHGFDRFLKPRLVPVLTGALLRQPRLAPAFFRSIVDGEPEPIIPAELMLLAVRADRQRSSLGSQLLDALEAEWRAAGVPRYRVSMRTELTAALEFYRQRGFVFEQERPVLGRPMTYLIKNL